MQSIHNTPVTRELGCVRRTALLHSKYNCNNVTLAARRPRRAATPKLQITCLKNYSGHDRVSTPTVNDNGIVV